MTSQFFLERNHLRLFLCALIIHGLFNKRYESEIMFQKSDLSSYESETHLCQGDNLNVKACDANEVYWWLGFCTCYAYLDAKVCDVNRAWGDCEGYGCDC